MSRALPGLAGQTWDSTGLRRSVKLASRLAAVAALTLAAFLAVRLTGGSPGPLNHLGYAPVLLAAYHFCARGGVGTGLVVALVLGPLPALANLPGGVEGPEAWLIRGLGFVAVGGVVGSLFSRTRTASESWRLTALKVIDREREGMTALARGIAAKDGHTGDHVTRVQKLTEDLALAAGLSQPEARDVGWSAMLHDVGKLHVPDSILLKPGPLTADEWRVIRQHSLWGEEILHHGDGFETARRVARWHHENFDGGGYPDGLKHERIPLEARLVRVADSFDAMTHRRPYQEPRPVDWALEELRRYAGRQFDPELVRLFIQLYESGRLAAVDELWTPERGERS